MKTLSSNSWLHLPEQNPRNTLEGAGMPPAVDCGWVEQMEPFISALTRPGDCILDPFCGWGTTLVAAAQLERFGIGVEIEADRAEMARKRLFAMGLEARAQVLVSDSRQIPLPDAGVDACLSSVPYFGPWKNADWQDDSRASGQCYRQIDYEAYLAILDAVFAEATRVLKPGGYLVVMAENLRINGRFVPLAWDCGRLIERHLPLGDERILTYEKKADSLSDGLCTNRAHEYALIARKPG